MIPNITPHVNPTRRIVAVGLISGGHTTTRVAPELLGPTCDDCGRELVNDGYCPACDLGHSCLASLYTDNPTPKRTPAELASLAEYFAKFDAIADASTNDARAASNILAGLANFGTHHDTPTDAQVNEWAEREGLLWLGDGYVEIEELLREEAEADSALDDDRYARWE